jgi:hypothetical protein
LARDWPAAVEPVVLVTTADNTGKAIGAWPSSEPIDMAMPFVTYRYKPTLTVLAEAEES